jgi:hypothetical protein
VSVRSAVMVSIGGLGTNLIGCYGGPWLSTPNLDRLAAHGELFDQFWLDAPPVLPAGDVATSAGFPAGPWEPNPLLWRSLWGGVHAARPLDTEPRWLADALRQANQPSLLVTDCSRLLESQVADHFEQRLLVPPPTATSDEAGGQRSAGPGSDHELEQTRLGQLLQAGLGLWLDQGGQGLLWLHSQGLYGAWDAPSGWRETLADPEDPPPPTDQEPPCWEVTEAVDPDDVHGWRIAAAAQAWLLERLWPWVEAAVAGGAEPDQCWLGLLGLGGYPLGQRGWLGPSPDRLDCLSLHAPLMWRRGPKRPLGIRRGELVQPADVWASLWQWLLPDQPGGERLAAAPVAESPSGLWPDAWGTHWQLALSRQGNKRQLVVPAWSWIDSGQGGGQLFASPEDVWQQNPVQELLPEVTEQLRCLADAYQRHLNDPHSPASPTVPAELLQLMR